MDQFQSSSYKLVEHVYQDPYTMVTIESKTTIGGRSVVVRGRGFTKRERRDVPSKTVGYEVALARAVEDMRRERDELFLRYQLELAKQKRAAEHRKKNMAAKMQSSTVSV